MSTGAEGMDADGNTTYKYANRQYKEWRTGRIGLSIKGYVANDGQDGENRDDLLRGDESMAGIVVTASQDNTVKGSGTTDASGFYSIENLAEGSYTIEAGAAANAIALHAITPNAAGTGWNFVTEKTATAHHNYPATFPDEQEVDKPYWIRNGHDDYTGTMGQSTSPLPDTDAKLYNFALVYTDGQLTGSVNNLSGSNASIDMLLTSPVPGEAVRKTETAGSAGTFEYNGLTEGIGYSVEIEDKGYSSPCLNASGAVDDLCPIIVDSDNDGTDDAPRMAPTFGVGGRPWRGRSSEPGRPDRLRRECVGPRQPGCAEHHGRHGPRGRPRGGRHRRDYRSHVADYDWNRRRELYTDRHHVGFGEGDGEGHRFGGRQLHGQGRNGVCGQGLGDDRRDCDARDLQQDRRR